MFPSVSAETHIRLGLRCTVTPKQPGWKSVGKIVSLWPEPSSRRKVAEKFPPPPVCVCVSFGVPGRKEDSTRKILKILSRAYALSEPPSRSATETTPAFVGGVCVCVRPSRPLFGCVKVKYQQNLAAAAPLLQLQQQQQHSCKSENLLSSLSLSAASRRSFLSRSAQ